MKGETPPLMYKFWDKLVLNKVRQQLGLDRTIKFFSGAAPLPYHTAKFFTGIGIFINNTFGMSETSAPFTTTLSDSHKYYDLKSAGKALADCQVLVLKSDPKSESGELCFRGRPIFMGYLKNEQATREVLDNSRLIHSGDEGKVNENGMMFITGRIKELLVTAGGENVAPVIIETNVKEELPFISNVMVIGDAQKYVSALLTFRVTSLAVDAPNHILAPEAIEYLEKLGIKGLKTVEDAMASNEVKQAIQAGIDRANKKAISNAARIKAWFIIPDDFSIPGGEFTPTLKVKRNIVTKKYAEKIQDLYSRPEL